MYKINILFFLARAKKNSQGRCPLKCRVTYLQKRKEFATGLFVIPEYWNSKLQKVHPPNIDNDNLNSHLSLIRQKMNQAFLFLQMEGNEFDVDDVVSKYKGEKPKEQKTVMDVIRYHNNRMEKLIGIETTFTSWEKYSQTQKHLEDFVSFKFGKKDFPLFKLNEVFLHDFEYYLKTEKTFKDSTTYKSIQRFRKMMKLALSMDYLKKDPFIFYKAKRYKKEIVYLTKDELLNLRNYTFAQQRLEQVRDMFVLCCYTGLAYREMANLSPQNIIENFDGNLWIQMKRQKTGKEISIPLMSIAEKLIEKYRTNDSLLPLISNQKFNSYLKEIALLVGIEKNLTHHIARKTFATTVLLYNDVPMEIVSELLGHSNISITTESYGKVIKKKVSDHMIKLSKRLK